MATPHNAGTLVAVAVGEGVGDGVAVSDLEPELLELQDALEQVRQEAPRYLALTD